ncbi:triphosphate tunnel metalloenzyme 3-like [Populus alba x Populus x berolinensis]|uniref:Triphosphate tunnel metalloenzyme 3-like n=1 Tax=Populus alba x Populus x berolinensis TaxID=444605 RepID=A0AAD6WA39_9ROSI|nr:triphosphate tunnel metalloenzyme 3-like [Populus alba x Populus x berolinensis]
MEVEVKLRLPDSNSHQKLSIILASFHTKTLIQENIFFDTTNSKLSSNFAALRLRFYNLDSYCGLIESSKIIQRVRREFGVGENEVLVCLGMFRNVRQVFDWKGLKLELVMRLNVRVKSLRRIRS